VNRRVRIGPETSIHTHTADQGHGLTVEDDKFNCNRPDRSV